MSRLLRALTHGIAAATAFVALAAASPAAFVVYVAPDSGSDQSAGTSASPLRTVGAALQRVDPGGTVVLLPGTIRSERLSVGGGQTITAAQPGTVRWELADGSAAPALEAVSGTLAVSGISFAAMDGTPTAIRVDNGALPEAHAHVIECRFADFAGSAVTIIGGQDHYLRDLKVERSGRALGVAAFTFTDCGFTIEDSQFVDGLSAIAVDSGASRQSLLIQNCTFQDFDSAYLRVHNPYAATIRENVFEGASESGIPFSGLGVGIELRGVRTSGAEARIEGNAFARLGGALALSDCGAPLSAEIPATVQFLNNDAFNLGRESLVSDSATAGYLRLVIKGNLFEYAPGFRFAEWNATTRSVLDFTNNRMSGYRKLAPTLVDFAIDLRVLNESAERQNLKISRNSFTNYATGVRLTAAGPITFQFTDLGRIASCDTALDVSGALAQLEMTLTSVSQWESAMLRLQGATASIGGAGGGNLFRGTTANIAVISGGAPAPTFERNWYSEYFVENSPLLYASTPLPLGGGLQDTAPATRFDRDMDGLPDVYEAALNFSPTVRDTNSDGVPDGVEAVVGKGLFRLEPIMAGVRTIVDADNDLVNDAIDPDPTKPDADGDGIADWYEIAMETDPTDSASRPELGDVYPNAKIDLADAVRALQLVNGAVPFELEFGNLNAMDVAGEGSLRSLNNPLQMLRFQSGSRRALPAIGGIQ